MNNLMSIDHAIRDYIDDTDYLLPRVSMEFPRISSQYSSKHSFSSENNKPWANKSDPIYFEPILDSNFTRFITWEKL